jgi:predicted transcriptional regulator
MLNPIKNINQMQTDKYPFAQELITDIEGNIKKVVMDFQEYLRLLEAIEDEGLILAMKEVENETPLNSDQALAELEKMVLS